MLNNNSLETKKRFTKKEVAQLGKEMQEAKAEVLLRWGFSIKEIAGVLLVEESVAEQIVKRITEKTKE